MIINTKRKPPRTKQQAAQAWLEKVQARIVKRQAKDATRKRPKKAVEFSIKDLSPELIAKLGLNDINNSEQVPPSTDQELPWD